MTTLMRTLPAWLCLLAACGSDPKPPPETPAPAPPPPAEAAPPAAQSEKPGDDPSKGQLNIDDAIKKACGITDAEAYFGYDSANLLPEHHALLEKLAKCFIDGPLKGKTMRLVGHADPRGESEYNIVLGGKRADSVKSVLLEKKLPESQVETTSRGEMDATGTDETGWAQDRRVDVVLAN